MKSKILGMSLLAVGLAGAAYAAAPQMGADPLGDKAVTKAEFLAKHGEMFDKMDANHDGKLDQADRAAHEKEMFDRLDTDRNGALSFAEFTAAHQRGPMGGPETAEGPREGKGKRHGGGHGMGMRMIAMADTNKDGAVTRAEFLAGAAQHFDMMDSNKDGSFSAAERKAAHAKMKGMHRGGRDEHQMGDMPPPPPPGN